MKPAESAEKSGKLFILDANVLLHDPASLFRFESHDVYLPIQTLEELDKHKTGLSETSRNAREVSRWLDALASRGPDEIRAGIDLRGPSKNQAWGRLFFQTDFSPVTLPEGFSAVDDRVLGVVIGQKRLWPERPVILVSKDVNRRIKARLLGLDTQDYFSDPTLEDADTLYGGVLELPDDFLERHAKEPAPRTPEGRTLYRIEAALCREFHVNEFLFSEGEKPFCAIVRKTDEKSAEVETLTDYADPKNAVWGIAARNREQNFALNLLMDPEIDFVSLAGQAGTGKTLLTLAAALFQTLETRRYSEIIVTRATVPVGDDIGFLPGSEEEKMNPWMGALEDNLEVLNTSSDEAGEWGRAATRDLVRRRIKIKSLNFMRGRTFLNRFLILDEAQNLTPKQMKTLITRAGPGTKVVCMGNIAQIDTPYLTEASSGLSYVVERFRGWPHSGHVTLRRGERSRLADHAAEAL